MALPELPTQGQNPWYEPRNNWDVSVRAELEGRLSESSLEGTVYAIRGARGEDASGLSLFFPEAHGAIGDGVTDDTASIQEAVDAAPVSGGRVVLNSGSTYRVDGAIILRTGIHLDLNGATLLKAATSTEGLLLCNVAGAGQTGYGGAGRNITVSGGTIAGTLGGATKYPAISEFHHVTNLKFENVVWHQAMSGTHAIDLLGCDDVTVTGCVFRGNSPGTLYDEAIQLDVSTYVSSSNKSRHDASSYDGLPTRNVRVTDSQFMASGAYGMPIPFGSHTSALDSDAGWYQDIRFERNTCTGGPVQDGTVHGWLHFSGIRNLWIADNVFTYIGAGGTGQSSVITLRASLDGISEANVAVPAAPPTTWVTPRGIANITIRGNTFRGFSTAPYASNGSLISVPLDAGACDGLDILDNGIDGASASAVRVAPAASGTYRVDLRGNRIAVNGDREAVLLSFTTAVVSENTIVGGTNQPALFLNTNKRSRVTGNEFSGGARQIRVAGDTRSVITGNHFTDYTYAGLELSRDGDGPICTGTIATSNVFTSTASPVNSCRVGTKSTGARVFGNDFLTGDFADVGVSTLTGTENRM